MRRRRTGIKPMRCVRRNTVWLWETGAMGWDVLVAVQLCRVVSARWTLTGKVRGPWSGEWCRCRHGNAAVTVTACHGGNQMEPNISVVQKSSSEAVRILLLAHPTREGRGGEGSGSWRMSSDLNSTFTPKATSVHSFSIYAGNLC